MRAARVRVMGLGVLSGCLLAGSASALELAELTNPEAASGIKSALDQGAAVAVAKLGVPGGFLNNPQVKIPLPPALDDAVKAMRMLGRGKDADGLVEAMNRAAEMAVPYAKPMLVGAVKSMTFEDAKKILTGGNDSATQYFKAKTSASLAVTFLPIVKRETDKVGLAQKYDQVAAQGERFGLIKGDASIEEYVTHKALDGLYLVIGEEELAIREHPAAAASAIAAKVFGALR